MVVLDVSNALIPPKQWLKQAKRPTAASAVSASCRKTYLSPSIRSNLFGKGLTEGSGQGRSWLLQHWSSHPEMRATASSTTDVPYATCSISMLGHGQFDSIYQLVSVEITSNSSLLSVVYNRTLVALRSPVTLSRVYTATSIGC